MTVSGFPRVRPVLRGNERMRMTAQRNDGAGMIARTE
jgi:hypothetical protein